MKAGWEPNGAWYEAHAVEKVGTGTRVSKEEFMRSVPPEWLRYVVVYHFPSGDLWGLDGERMKLDGIEIEEGA
jgi:hypothetical protein